jgi:hypothetical protein
MSSRFRTSFTQIAGTEAARIVQARVANINLKNWTVDVYAQFDRKRYFDIRDGCLVCRRPAEGEAGRHLPAHARRQLRHPAPRRRPADRRHRARAAHLHPAE